jgi:hypothetical protein
MFDKSFYRKCLPIGIAYLFFLLGSLGVIPPWVPNQAMAETKESIDLSTAIIRVAKQNIPAVVHIEVTARQEVMNPLLPFENDPFFRHFFGTPKMP